MNNLGTWIDWQYLLNAAKLLAKVQIVLLADVFIHTSVNSQLTHNSPVSGSIKILISPTTYSVKFPGET